MTALWQTLSQCKEHPGSCVQLLPCCRTSGTRGPDDKWVQAVLSSLHSTMLGFRCLRSAQMPSYKGKPHIHSSNNFLLQDPLSTDSPKSRRGLRKVSYRGVLCVSLGLCQASELHKSHSARSWVGHSRSPAPAATPTISQRSTALINLSTH